MRRYRLIFLKAIEFRSRFSLKLGYKLIVRNVQIRLTVKWSTGNIQMKIVCKQQLLDYGIGSTVDLVTIWST
jgi:hypothetical protein